MARLLLACSFVLFAGCSSSEPASTTDASTDAACTSTQFLVYPKAGCGGSVAPVCADPTDTGCVTIVCGCDGKVHLYDCAGARAPFASDSARGEEGDTCGDAGVDAGPSDATDAGPCGAGKHPAFTTAGCAAEPTCLPDGPEDACATTFCGCDGKTFSGACGYSPKPFASKDACPDAGDGA